MLLEYKHLILLPSWPRRPEVQGGQSPCGSLSTVHPVHRLVQAHADIQFHGIDKQMNIIKRLLVKSIVTNTPLEDNADLKITSQAFFFSTRPLPLLQVLLCKDLRQSDAFANVSTLRGRLALCGSHLGGVHASLEPSQWVPSPSCEQPCCLEKKQSLPAPYG